VFEAWKNIKKELAGIPKDQLCFVIVGWRTVSEQILDLHNQTVLSRWGMVENEGTGKKELKVVETIQIPQGHFIVLDKK